MSDYVSPFTSKGSRRKLGVINGKSPGDHRGGRSVIRVVSGDIERVVDEAEDALIASGRGLYQRNAKIVSVGEAKIITSDRQSSTAQMIFPRGDHALREDLCSAATFQKYDRRVEDWKTIDAPMDVVHTLKQRQGRLRLPVLTGIINSPTIRADGSILQTPGWDPKTGLLFDPRGTRFSPQLARPSRSDALASVALLDQLISEIPFVSGSDRAVALSAILTACSRNAYANAPMHAVSAPTAGTGKSLVIDIATAVATGRKAAVIAIGKTAEEMEKRLGGALLSGDPVLALDNCDVGIGGDFICQMLTQDEVTVRPLGGSELIKLRTTNVFVTATGNNLQVIGDMTRRTLVCKLDAGLERPEMRTFKTPHPVKAVLLDRDRYVTAALTIMRAYFVAGRPPGRHPLGSFEDWSHMVRDSLIWLGKADPVGTMEEARLSDPTLDALTAVLSHWRDVIRHDQVTTRQIIERATESRESYGSSRPTFLHPEFREALLTVAGEGGAVNTRKLGKWLGNQKGRIVRGYAIDKAPMLDGNTRWQLHSAALGE